MAKTKPCWARVTGPLAEYAAGFRDELFRLGYTPLTAACQLRLTAHLSRWMTAEGLTAPDLDMPAAERYFAARRLAGYANERTTEALGPLLGYLRRLRTAPLPPAAPATETSLLLDRFAAYLASERGLAPGTVALNVRLARPFLQQRALEHGGRPDLEQLTAGEVRAFVLDQARKQPRSAKRIAGPAGTRQVTAGLGLSLALAAAAGAPVRLADAVLDRLAVPVPSDDLLTPFLNRVPPGATALPGHGLRGWPLATLPGRRPRYEPRNLDFADGLDRWDLDSGPGPDPGRPGAADGEPDYAAAAEGPSAVLSSTVPRPAGSAALIQAIYADDYRGATVTSVSDGDLARLARGGDPVAFRLLVERHQPMVRARARQLAPDPGDVDDIVQESFLQAFLALDRLRDPDRFAGWLAGIVLNVCRRLHRGAPVTLLADWPEPLHPTSAGGLPSTEDLDRADALRAAVAGLPAGQRRAVTLHYYADVPAGQVAEAPGAARASLHKARLRLRAYLTEHRPDLVPASGRTPMTTVRVARIERRIPPGPLPDRFPTHVIVLADDAGRRDLPIWLLGGDSHRFDDPRPSADELTDRLLRAAGTRVTAVDVDELGPEVTAARIELATPAGPEHVTARLLDGLAMAITAGAPIRVANAVMDRLAVPAGPATPARYPSRPRVAWPSTSGRGTSRAT